MKTYCVKTYSDLLILSQQRFEFFQEPLRIWAVKHLGPGNVETTLETPRKILAPSEVIFFHLMKGKRNTVA